MPSDRRRRSVTVFVDQDQYERLTAMAAATDRSVSGEIRHAIRNHVEGKRVGR